jgi:hypothetical protein
MNTLKQCENQLIRSGFKKINGQWQNLYPWGLRIAIFRKTSTGFVFDIAEVN